MMVATLYVMRTIAKTILAMTRYFFVMGADDEKSV